MKYMGSKNRHAKHIIPILMENHSGWYIDPFVGGANIIDKVPTEKRFGSDNHFFLIAMWNGLLDGSFVPPDFISETEYQDIRQNETDPALVGYVGFNSFGGKWWGGYRRDKTGKRDYWLEHKNNLLKQLPNLKGVIFKHKSYLDLYIPKGSTVYCDPPYANTTKYTTHFDHDLFWEWVRVTSRTSRVFVSEYQAPPDFKCVWSKAVNNTLVKDTGSKQGVEKLFTLSP